ncbi:MAG: S8 family serine peptidase [Alphaproteobacteria bacterium]|nr:S8 family serine peptidase [Alphaproteobacteria bacterium]
MLKKLLIGVTILSYGTAVVAQTLRFGMVWEAVKKRDEVTLGTILKTYKTVDVEDKKGQTPLCYAIEKEDYEGYVLLLKYGASRSHACVQQMKQEQRKEFNQDLREYFEDKGGISSSTLLWEAMTVAAGGALMGFAVSGKGGSGDGSGAGAAGNKDGVGTEGLPGETLTANDFKTQAYENSGFLDNIGAAEAYARFYKGDKGDKDSDGHIKKLYTNVKDVKVAVVDTGVYPNDALVSRLESGFNYDYGPCGATRTSNCWKQGVYTDGITPVAILLDEKGNSVRYVMMSATAYQTWADQYEDGYVYDPTDTTPNMYSDDAGHGTFVSSVIAADRTSIFTHGVALNAQIIPIKYDLMGGLNKPIISAVDAGAKVINLSLGTNTVDKDGNKIIDASIFKDPDNRQDGIDALEGDLKGLAYISQKQTTALVFAAGNEGTEQPSLEAGVGLLSSELSDDNYKNLKDLTVVSVAVDQNNNIANFSNKCGVTKDYCIAAPGVNVTGYTEAENSSYVSATSGSGTSFSTPVVSGALAFLMGAYPNMTVAQVIDLVFETATDLGEKGVDEVYGHGLLNLDAATAPQGDLKVASTSAVSSANISLASLRLKMPNIMSGVLRQMPSGFAAFDKYERSFTMPISSVVSVSETDGKKFQNALHRFMKFDSVKTVGNDETPMSFSFSTATNTESEMGIGSMDISWNFDNSKVRFYYMEDGSFGMGNYIDRTMVNPFMAVDNAYGFENSYRFGQKYSLAFGLVSGDNALFKVNEDDMDDVNRLSVFHGGATFKPTENVSFSFLGGVMNEDSSLMGLRGKGGFDVENSQTYYTGVMAQVQPLKNFMLTGAYYYGMTPANRLNAFMETGKLYSESVSFDARYHFDDNQYVGALLMSPLRVRSGHMNLTLPTGRDYYSDMVYTDTYRLKMASEAREWDAGVYGQFNLADNIQAKMQGIVRFNPEHQANVKPDYQVMFGLNWLWH